MINSEEAAAEIHELDLKESGAEIVEGELKNSEREIGVPEEDSMVDFDAESALNDNASHEGRDMRAEGAPEIEKLKKELEALTRAEERLFKTVEIMEMALAQSGNPDFKVFWESRKNCLELFKENIPPAVKAQHWAKYRELTKEAKRLKEIFEEQAAFAIEQIEIAILGLEKDIKDFGEQLEKMDLPVLPQGIKAIKENLNIYLEKQRELNLLNAQAARINALRKELIRTEMRVKQKNKFFQRLSSAGDHVFPRRKELIKELSQQFIHDINYYIRTHFNSHEGDRSLHFLREEIKALQAVAKMMTLNTSAFTETRLKLSECWDKLKLMEKERKAEQAQQKVLYKENAEAVSAKIKEFTDLLGASGISTHEAQKRFDEIGRFMRSKELGKDELKVLRDELNLAYKPLKTKMLSEEKKRRDLELEAEQSKQAKFKEVEDRISKLIDEADAIAVEQGIKEIEQIDGEIKYLELSEFEKDSLTRQLVPVGDRLEQREIFQVLELDSGNADKRLKIQALLKKMTQEKFTVKEQIEKYRKACGGSGLDFEQSLYFNEQLTQEKTRYETKCHLIDSLESELAKLSKKK